MSELYARLIEQSGELEDLEDVWWRLWRRLPAGTPFQSPAWLLPWWRTFHPGPLFTIAVFSGELLVGLAPLYLEHSDNGARLLPIGISLSDRLDLLVDPTHDSAVIDMFAVTLERVRNSWTEWCMPELPRGAVAARIRPASSIRAKSSGSACPILRIEGESGLGNVPPTQRRKLHMAQNRVARSSGAIIPQRELSPGEWWQELSRLHTARWTSRGESGVLQDDAAARFHRAALEALSKSSLSRLYGLRWNDRIVGVYYGLLHGDTAYAYLGGFDPEASYFSPGTVLIGHAIAEATREGARHLDFLRGREPYKYRWGAVDSVNGSLRVVQQLTDTA